MKEEIHILTVLKKVLNALEREDIVEIKKLSNQVIHSASIEQDATSISTAVIIYSLSKIIEREHYRKLPGWSKFYNRYITGIKNSIKALEKKDYKTFDKEIHYLRNIIQNLSGNLKIYIQEVFRKAAINKASKIYEHGISMEKTSKSLGITLWELAEYAGQKKELPLTVTLPIKKRMKYAEEIFK